MVNDPNTEARWAPRLTPSARWALAALSGLLNGAGFIWLGPLALIANVPLLCALWGARTAATAAGLGGLVGVLAGAHIYGILDYGAWILVAFSLYTGSQMVLYGLLMRALWGRAGPAFDVALPALVWALTEWIRTLGPLSMPASYVGNIADLPAFAPWLALAPHTGGLGVSTLIALAQSVVFHLTFVGGRHRRPALLAAALLALAGLAGHLAPPPLGDRPLTVAGVQGGLANSQYRAALADPAVMREVVATYETLTRAALDSGADLVVWPETAVRAPVLDTPALRARLFPRADDRGVLIAGLIGRDPDGRSQNLAVALAPGGRELGRQPKVRLVPGTEAHFTPGAAWAPLDTPAGRVGALICLESVYPHAGRALAAAGAELLVVMSNDAGFGRSPITDHMTRRAIVRALETGRWLLRVGQAGVTTLIDPRGGRHGALGLFEPGILRGEARLRDDLTLYVRLGDWWMALCGALLALGALAAWRRSRAVSARSTT
ncbi:MAG: apolipoprotein N-acyltransferase [Myxococcales bacterium]|nr:apolipoprotein N-acyltransferase [Myxococcales bacterium]